MGCYAPQVSNKGPVTFWRVGAVCRVESWVCVCGLCRMQGWEVALVCLETVWDAGCLEGGRLVVNRQLQK